MAVAKKSARAKPKQTPEPTELLETELREIYSAETQLTRALPRLSKAVESDRLREMLDLRRQQAEALIQDLDRVFEEMESSPGRKRNVAAEGLLNDAQEHVQEIAKGPALDAILVGAVQKLEHYCIAAWGTSRAFAEALEIESAAQVMQRVLDEGRQLDEDLTQLAEEEINPAMLAMGEEEDDEGAEMEDDETPAKPPGRPRSRNTGKEVRQ
jgi:ferritin-like metal-binding protein YciE